MLRLTLRPDSAIILFIFFNVEELPLFSNVTAGGVQKKLKQIKHISSGLRLNKSTIKEN